MRRITCVVILIAGLLAPTSAPAGLPALAGTNVVHGVGSAAALVRLTERTAIDWRRTEDLFYSFETSGAFAAILIEEVGKPKGSAQQTFHMRVFAPNGCALKSNDSNLNCWPSEHSWHQIAESGEQVPETMTFEPGLYRIYLLTTPGKKITAQFSIPGLGGRTAFHTSVPVRSKFVAHKTRADMVGHITGKITGRLLNDGVVTASVWRTGERNNGVFYSSGDVYSCWERGRREPDEFNMCGFPLQQLTDIPDAGGNPRNLYASKGTYSYGYQYLAPTLADERMGAYALFLTFL